MRQVRNFLDNLKNLRLVASVALEHLQENRSHFVVNAGSEDLREFERYVSQVRGVLEEMEKEFNTIEYLIARRIRNSIQ